MSKPDIIRQLSARIRRLEQPRSLPDSEFHETSTGIDAFDALLPAGGLTGGTMIEWLSPPGGGAGTLALALASRILNADSALVVVDSSHEFYPPAVVSAGLSLQQFVVIRPQHISEATWVFEQSLRCSGVTITMAWLEHLTDSVFRRLQLAAETGGGIGFLFRPGRFRSQRSWADVRLLVQPVVRVADVPVRGRSPEAAVGSSDPCAGTGETEQRWMRRVRVELLHCRGRVEGGHVELEIDDETSDVRLAAGVATAKDLHRKTGA